MSIRRQSGVTLVEMIIAIAIIGVGLAGVLGALARTSVFSAHPMVSKQLSAIAEGMMEEVLLQPFAPPAGPPGTNNNACARNGFNHVSAYNGYSTNTICDQDGTPVAGLAGYRVSVAVQPSASSIAGVPAADILVVTVTASNASQSYALTGWRTNYTR
jgi:MSHA pilin protein MshD